jgi:hypothetical protein
MDTPQFRDDLRRLASRLRDLGRTSLDESDWSGIYARAAGAPKQKKSNLPFRDYTHNGVGIEWKFLKRANPAADMGKRLMHPSATRRIELNPQWNPDDAKDDVLRQWGEAIREFKSRASDIRWGVVLYRPDFSQFLYFEEPIDTPDPSRYTGEWTTGQHRGRTTRNLSIKDLAGNKAFSVTLPRNGAKLQPYFLIPQHATVVTFDWFYRSLWIPERLLKD